MTKYEYRLITISGDNAEANAEDEMNQFGADGWRVSHVIPASDQNHRQIVLERETN